MSIVASKVGRCWEIWYLLVIVIVCNLNVSYQAQHRLLPLQLLHSPITGAPGYIADEAFTQIYRHVLRRCGIAHRRVDGIYLTAGELAVFASSMAVLLFGVNVLVEIFFQHFLFRHSHLHCTHRCYFVVKNGLQLELFCLIARVRIDIKICLNSKQKFLDFFVSERFSK